MARGRRSKPNSMQIFISYRHSEASGGTASLIHARLTEHFGAGSVFLDSGYIATGDRFTTLLETQVAACSVFLALIDPHWLASMPRLHEPTDWVRREIETALDRLDAGDSVRVVPVLIQGASLPAAEQLPHSLTRLVELQSAPPLRGRYLEQDLAALITHLDGWTLDRWLVFLQTRRGATIRTALAVVLLFAASVVALFDMFTIETRFDAFTLALADALDNRPPSDRLALVVVDGRTEAQLGKRFDISWREQHAVLIRRLAEAGAAVIAFDVTLRETSRHDAELTAAAAAARQRGTRVVFGAGGRGGTAAPVAGVEFGLLCIGTELDWARTSPLLARRPAERAVGVGAGAPAVRHLPALGALAARPGAAVLAVDTEHRQIVLAGSAGGSQMLPYSRTERIVGDPACEALQRGDEVAQRIVRFTALERLRAPERRHRYEDVIAGQSLPRAAEFEGKVVLVGTELGDGDRRLVYRGLSVEERHGYEVHADVINTLLQDVNIRPLPLLPQFLVTLGMGALGLAARFWPPLWSRWRGWSFMAACTAGFLAFGVWLCADFHWLLGASYPLAALAFAYWISGVLLRQRGLWHPERH